MQTRSARECDDRVPPRTGTTGMQTRSARECDDRVPPRTGTFELLVARRHVDLLRVSSALCPRTSPRR
ncbi:putative leader peptide [Streptomyces sp. NPDC048438]|uniref:putative leader peptide n=1 Tax=Streptomyces sp. NPDC048438 TaxID=3365551 RepID=UPI0037134DC7